MYLATRLGIGRPIVWPSANDSARRGVPRPPSAASCYAAAAGPSSAHATTSGSPGRATDGQRAGSALTGGDEVALDGREEAPRPRAPDARGLAVRVDARNQAYRGSGGRPTPVVRVCQYAHRSRQIAMPRPASSACCTQKSSAAQTFARSARMRSKSFALAVVVRPEVGAEGRHPVGVPAAEGLGSATRLELLAGRTGGGPRRTRNASAARALDADDQRLVDERGDQRPNLAMPAARRRRTPPRPHPARTRRRTPTAASRAAAR